MRIIIDFSDENAAFEDNGSTEYNQIIFQALKRIHYGGEGVHKLQDTNGNKV